MLVNYWGDTDLGPNASLAKTLVKFKLFVYYREGTERLFAEGDAFSFFWLLEFVISYEEEGLLLILELLLLDDWEEDLSATNLLDLFHLLLHPSICKSDLMVSM